MLDEAKEIRKGEELDWDSLEEYLSQHLADMAIGTMNVSQFHGGHANLTYLIKFSTCELIVRRPPFGNIAPGAHDMKREFRVLSKLYKVLPEAPRAYLYCDDGSVIGAPFVVMERKHGVLVRYEMIEEFQSFDRAEERVTTAMIRAMADLHTVDIEKADLTKLGRPEGFLSRQLLGWSKRWELSKSGDDETMQIMDDVFELLSSSVPIPQAVSIIHNDIKLDNCQFSPDSPDKVTAIFDWDMTTLGDPLVDIGSTLSYWYEPFFDGYDMPVFLDKSFPRKDFLIEKYAEFTGFSIENIDWYHAFAVCKASIVAAQLYVRYLNGKSTDKRMEKFGTLAKNLPRFAKHLLENKNS